MAVHVAFVAESSSRNPYRARCSCGWVAQMARPAWSSAKRDAEKHIGQAELPDPAPTLFSDLPRA